MLYIENRALLRCYITSCILCPETSAMNYEYSLVITQKSIVPIYIVPEAKTAALSTVIN